MRLYLNRDGYLVSPSGELIEGIMATKTYMDPKVGVASMKVTFLLELLEADPPFPSSTQTAEMILRLANMKKDLAAEMDLG